MYVISNKLTYSLTMYHSHTDRYSNNGQLLTILLNKRDCFLSQTDVKRSQIVEHSPNSMYNSKPTIHEQMSMIHISVRYSRTARIQNMANREIDTAKMECTNVTFISKNLEHLKQLTNS